MLSPSSAISIDEKFLDLGKQCEAIFGYNAADVSVKFTKEKVKIGTLLKCVLKYSCFQSFFSIYSLHVKRHYAIKKKDMAMHFISHGLMEQNVPMKNGVNVGNVSKSRAKIRDNLSGIMEWIKLTADGANGKSKNCCLIFT